jgi:hypothetical protein
MDLPDLDEPFDPDLSFARLWEQVPEPIRKSVESMWRSTCQPMSWRSFVTCTPAELRSVLTRHSSILAAALPSGIFAESGLVTTSWQLAAA